jgi:hypothetical protein
LVSIILGRFAPGKEPQYPVNKRIDEIQSYFGRFGEEK